jgi:hypothetical protein
MLGVNVHIQPFFGTTNDFLSGVIWRSFDGGRPMASRTGEGTPNCSVSSTTFAGTGSGDRWFGALARYTNETNYYYLSLRSGGSVSLRKVTNGTVTVLGSATLPVTVGRWYSLRLEAVGSRLRGYVDGKLLLEATDSTHPQGKSGLVTYRTAAEYAGYRALRP